MPKINQNIDKIPFYLTKKVSEGAAAEPGAINLSRGQAGFLPPLEIYKAAKKIINPKDKTVFRYEKATGSIELRKAMSKWYKKQFNLDVSPENIVITVGGTGGIALALLTLTNPGDQIIIPDPSYPFYMLSAQYGLENREIKRVVIGNEKLTRKKLEPVIAKNTKVVIITSSHNPTGVVYDAETLKELVELAEEKDFFILCDENHFPEIYDNKKHLPITLFDKKRKYTVLLGSLSRFALQGERIGWAILPEEPKGFAENFAAHSPFTNTTAQKLATYFFEEYDKLNFNQYFEDYEEKRNWLIPELNKIEGFECPMPEGTSYSFVNIKKFADKHKEKLKELVQKESEKRGFSEEDIQLSLNHKSILVQKFFLYCIGVGCVPGIAYGPGSDDYIRFTFSVEKEELEEAIKRLKKIPEYLK